MANDVADMVGMLWSWPRQRACLDQFLSIPKSKAIPWKIVWEKLIEWDHFLANENRINRFGQTRSSEGRRDQLGGSVQEANAEIQPGGHFIRIDRPSDIDRIFINILVGFSKIAMKKLLILLIIFAFIWTVKASDIDDLIIKGLPVKVLSSSKSYKVFEQYPWEGRSSNYGPKGNRLNSSYGVGVGKNIFRSLQLRHGDWIHMPAVGWRQINESSSKNNSVEFFAAYRDEYKSKYPRITIDMVAFALPSRQEPSLASEF